MQYTDRHIKASLHPATRIETFAVRNIVSGVSAALFGMAVVATTLAPHPALAAETVTAKTYSVPAGSLSQALYSFASSAGITLSFDPSLTEGLRSPGLSGSHSIQDGLEKILAGSGLEVVAGTNGGYRLRKLPDTSATVLPAVHVSAPMRDASTEGTNAYAARGATIGKTTQSLREIPQAVTVLTRQFLDDRVLPDLTNVMQNTPGVTVDYTDSERVNYYSRGYQIDALQIDGLTVNQSGTIFVQPDTAVLDRVEILRGASGMLRGSGNPSATVNLVRKRPTSEFQGSAALTLGSWDRRRLEADISGPLNEAGTLRGRIVAVNDEKNFFQQARHEDRKVFYGVIEADLGPRTTFTASLQHTDLDATGAWGGMPANFDGTQLNLPRNTYLGADWNRWNRYNQQALAELKHRFDNDWTVRLSAAYTGLRMKGDGFKQTSFSRASKTNPYLANVSTSVYSGDASDQRVFSVTANGPFSLLGRKHELVIGAESQNINTTGTSGYWGLSPTTVDIRNWNPYTSMAEPYVSAGNGNYYSAPNSSTSQQGVYGTARLSITDPLTLLIGARVSWWDYKVPTQVSSNYSVNREVTPYAGLIYDFSENLSAYASYTEIFNPQDKKTASGQLLAPVQGQNYEMGIKGEFFNKRLNAAFSVFRINNVGAGVLDASTANPCLPYYLASNCYIDGGKTRSEGFELELTGELMPGWQIMGGYTNTRTRYIADASASNVGQPLHSIDPKHLLRLFTTYRIGGEMQGWTIGGGAQVQSDSYVRSGNVTSHQGGYAVYNAMVGYRFDKTYSVQLNVNNLFDKVYYAKFSPDGFNNYYADPRNVMVSLRANF